MPPKYLAQPLTHVTSAKSMSESDWQWGIHGDKEALREIFLVSLQVFTYSVSWVFSAEINLETGVYRANYFHMNSDLHLVGEVKTSKIFTARCLAGYNLRPHFNKQHFHADLLDNLAPCGNSLLLSFIYYYHSPHGNRTLLWKQHQCVGEERRWVVFLHLTCLAVALSSPPAFSLGFYKLNCLLTILFLGSAAEMHLKVGHSSWWSRPQKSTLIWDAMVFPMAGRRDLI